ncbi:acetyl esterase/lipase [Amycolatopsis lexingtonensis]|uniref:Acetyl esterase/lipase n=2 Tax=Amycolatopsis lexingtonensis TaxID=218822 RepID=A0ABR9HRD6_9PSEU|nr:alpha/beta hydrolase [Amycolatopsis lexingtonensis]MBE1493470.1 acetyl esterase/lipase [Amycolatopsis lexingtonensis]
MKVVDGQRSAYRPPTPSPTPLRRGPVLVTAAFAGLGGALIPAAAVPALWRIWQLYAMLFGAVAAVEVVAVVAVLGWPTRKTARFGALTAFAALALWVPSRPLGLLVRLDPWQPADTVVGFTDYVAAGLQVIALFGFLVVARRRAHPRPSALRRVSAWIVLSPVLLLVIATGAAGTVAAGDGIRGTGASALLDGGTVEYCRPGGVPLAMDLRRPAGPGPAPVVLFLHGGGLLFGNRKPSGPGALLAGTRPDELTARGFAVASIDYRLAPAARWPSPLEDARCAVRFLETNATALAIDPARIAVWGTGAGGTLAALVALTPGTHIRAAAALAAPAAFTDFRGMDTLTRASVLLALGRAPATLRSASPLTYPAVGAPPFLVAGGWKSAEFADHLRQAGVTVTTSPDVAAFFAAALR